MSSEITTFACRSCPGLEKATSSLPLMARYRRTRRSLRTCACVDIPSARTGRSHRYPPHTWWEGSVGEGLRPYVRRVRRWEVRWSNSTCEAGEQDRNPGGGVCGGKGATRGKCTYRRFAPDSEPGHVRPCCKRLRLVGMQSSRPLNPREEPYEVVPHVRICAGGRRQRRFLPR